MATREIYKVDQNTGKSTYAGYGKFDSEGNYQGSFGGYGSTGRNQSGSRKASQVQNTISTVSARQARRRPTGL